MADIVCLGEALIDFVAMEACGDVGEASGFIRAPGGAPANVAVGAARLGISSAFLGKVGDDPFGRYLGRSLAGAGVDIHGMVFDAVHRTGLAFVSLAANGERDFCFFRNPSADMTYSPEEVDTAAIASCRVFHFGSITLIDPLAKIATISAIEQARAGGKLISYDPNLRPPLWPSLSAAQTTILEAARYADLVKVSEEELSFLFSKTAQLMTAPAVEADTCILAQQFMRRFQNVSLLAVTQGSRGCLWWTASGEHGRHPSYSVHAIDTTGAGDGFVAGLLTGILGHLAATNDAVKSHNELLSQLNDSALNRVFARANAVGAITTTRKGAIPALPTAEELEQFMAVRTPS